MRWALLLAIAACSKAADPAPADPPAQSQPQTAQAAAAKHEDRHEPATAAPAISLAISIAGATPAGTTWTGETLAGAPRMAGAASDGEARDTWSLRELARRNIGPDARVVAVIGPDGKQAIEPAAWSDAARTPILHTTRRGTLKFRWADKDGHWGPTVVRDVTGLEIAR